MPCIAGTTIQFSAWLPRPSLQVSNGLSGLRSVTFSRRRKSFPTIQLRQAPFPFRVYCARPYFINCTEPHSSRLFFSSRNHAQCANAKPETLEKVCGIVKKQLALSEDATVTGESTLAQLGADSLDTVEIVMGFEEEFGISVEEDSAQHIQTVQDAADLIEKLVAKK